MCIAIAKQADIAINRSILQQCFNSNPDGAGFCIEINGSLVINKGYFTFDDFYTAFKPYENLKALIHFRIRTHGDKDETNCHPFYINDDLVFIHNGVINNVHAPANLSDTIVFNNNFLSPLVSKFGNSALTDPAVKPMIENFIGCSKLAMFVKGQEDFVFFNEAMGNRSTEGIWFSNTSWQAPKVYPPQYKDERGRFKGYKSKEQWDFWESESTIPKSHLVREKVTTITTTQGITFCIADQIKTCFDLTAPIGTIPRGAYGEITQCYSDKTVDINFYIEGQVNNLYTYALTRLDITPLLLNTWEIPNEC